MLQVGLLGSLALNVFDRFARAAISVGHLRIILPNGEELSYGDPSTTQPPIAPGGCSSSAFVLHLMTVICNPITNS